MIVEWVHSITFGSLASWAHGVEKGQIQIEATLAPGVQALTDGLAHFVARQAGPHGPEEEFVIVERVHGNITRRRVTS